jgi:hypothetical protein
METPASLPEFYAKYTPSKLAYEQVRNESGWELQTGHAGKKACWHSTCNASTMKSLKLIRGEV